MNLVSLDAVTDAAGQHITSNAKLALAVSRWWDVLKATFYTGE